MLSSLFRNFKEFFLSFQKPEKIKYVAAINVFYYTAFFLVAFFEIEWPQKQVLTVSNKQLGIFISIIFSVATYVIWSVVTYLIAKIFSLNYRLSKVIQAFFSLNLISFLALIINTILFLVGVSFFEYAILWIDLLVKVFLIFSFLYEFPQKESSKGRVAILCVCSILSMFLISSLFYLIPNEKPTIDSFNREDKLRIDSKTYVNVDSKIYYQLKTLKNGEIDSQIMAKDLVENYYFAVLYEKVIKASVTESGLYQAIKTLPNEVKSNLNSDLSDNEINIRVMDIKMDIRVATEEGQ